jgi:hypothetical protein
MRPARYWGSWCGCWRDQGFWTAKLIRGQVQDQALFRILFGTHQPSTLSGN